MTPSLSKSEINTSEIVFKSDEFHVATATTIEEAKELLAAGFDYVTEKQGIMLFRKPKIKALEFNAVYG